MKPRSVPLFSNCSRRHAKYKVRLKGKERLLCSGALMRAELMFQGPLSTSRIASPIQESGPIARTPLSAVLIHLGIEEGEEYMCN